MQISTNQAGTGKYKVCGGSWMDEKNINIHIYIFKFVDVDITEDVVETVARRLSGSTGAGGVDAQAVSHWLLQFGKMSQ
jgi:hypothetical protein